jgi:para-nitrobenzyl esterase
MQLEVTTTSGVVRGRAGGPAVAFLGIPYAAPPFGDLRFAAPQPVPPWEGVRDCTAYGPTAPKGPYPAPVDLLLPEPVVPGEDVLNLNVWTPDPSAAGLPVLVWVHGGAFVNGSGAVPQYDGTAFARDGVVLVTFNYRLGADGFLHFDDDGPANRGLLDQVAALEWVRDNIAAFGGDPGNVTIFGESAGGMSVGTLLGTPEAAGLFHRAIAQSGAASNTHDPEVAEWVAGELLAEVGLSPATAAGLLDVPVAELLRAQGVVEGEVLRGGGPPATAGGASLAFQPTVDEPPLGAVRDGVAAGVPVVIGTTAEEWNLFHIRARQAGPLDEGRVRRRLGRLIGEDRVDDAVDAYRSARPEADLDGLVCALMTDRVFRVPAIRLAEAQLPHSPRVSMYRFDLASTAFGGVLGACHAIDIPFVFGNLDRGGAEMFIGNVDDAAGTLSGRCVQAWVGTARTGVPEHGDLPWPAYDLDRRATCLLDRSPGVLDDPDGELRALWDEIDGVQPVGI